MFLRGHGAKPTEQALISDVLGIKQKSVMYNTVDKVLLWFVGSHCSRTSTHFTPGRSEENSVKSVSHESDHWDSNYRPKAR